jgi:hypothetical protein
LSPTDLTAKIAPAAFFIAFFFSQWQFHFAFSGIASGLTPHNSIPVFQKARRSWKKSSNRKTTFSDRWSQVKFLFTSNLGDEAESEWSNNEEVAAPKWLQLNLTNRSSYL